LDTTAVLIIAAVIFLWAVLSARLERADLTAPIVFVAVGALLSEGGLVHADAATESLKALVEITLVWVLFTDAARVRVPDLRSDAGLYARLLGVGLPLTVLVGWGLAAWLFPGLGWLALLVAAALAPTDAALGVPVVTNPVVPSRVRRLITVESGLNDGIATPIVMLALAGAASAERLAEAPGPAKALLELLIGAAVGVAIGVGGGGLVRWARGRGWVAGDFAGIAVLALAVAAYAAALAAHGNGFIAAFCGGLAFGAAAGRSGPAELVFTEQVGGLVSLLVWLAFGAIAVPIMVDRASWTILLYAVLSLSVVRMVPVALALLGAGLGRATVLFVGWFGPRGLASLVFALLAVEDLGSAADQAVAVVGATVFLSVLLHGISAAPLAARYGQSAAAPGPRSGEPIAHLPVRGLPRRRRAKIRAAGAETGPAEPRSAEH
jgi:NhaP-type Na+/H+ or K+/H+ antiporter